MIENSFLIDSQSNENTYYDVEEFIPYDEIPVNPEILGEYVEKLKNKTATRKVTEWEAYLYENLLKNNKEICLDSDVEIIEEPIKSLNVKKKKRKQRRKSKRKIKNVLTQQKYFDECQIKLVNVKKIKKKVEPLERKSMRIFLKMREKNNDKKVFVNRRKSKRIMINNNKKKKKSKGLNKALNLIQTVRKKNAIFKENVNVKSAIKENNDTSNSIKEQIEKVICKSENEIDENDVLKIDKSDTNLEQEILSKNRIFTLENNMDRCPFCGKALSFLNFYKHVLKHSEKPFECDICHRSFRYKRHVRDHLETHKEPERNRYNKYKKTKEENILKAKQNKEEFHCEICNKLIKMNNWYHMKYIHSNEKRHRCELCGKKFKSYSGLTRHIGTHPRNNKSKLIKNPNLNNYIGKLLLKVEKSHKCDNCDKVFTRKDSLMRHKRLHENEKQFQCDICKKRFPSKDRIRDHMKIHNKIKPFKCKICTENFIRKYSLHLHYKTHH